MTVPMRMTMAQHPHVVMSHSTGELTETKFFVYEHAAAIVVMVTMGLESSSTHVDACT